MPTFKHPCPHCGSFIARDVLACPACGARDPFTPARCSECRAPIDDPSWIACPKCGAPTDAGRRAASASTSPQPEAATASPTAAAAVAAHPGARPAESDPSVARTSAPDPTTATAAVMERRCQGCGAPLAAGARFCMDCGTLAD